MLSSHFRAHYPGTVSTESAKASGKSLWASEDYSTYSDSIGAACWAKVSVDLCLFNYTQFVHYNNRYVMQDQY